MDNPPATPSSWHAADLLGSLAFAWQALGSLAGDRMGADTFTALFDSFDQ